jgi:sugar lactone lactonase YvrE
MVYGKGARWVSLSLAVFLLSCAAEPALEIAPAHVTVTAGQTVVFRAASGVGDFDLIEGTKAGSIDAGSGLYTATDHPGVYHARLRRGSASALAVIEVVSAAVQPKILVAPRVTTGRQGLSASAPAIAGAVYDWLIDNGTITAGQGSSEIRFTAGSPGMMRISCAATNEAKTVGPRAEAIVEVEPNGIERVAGALGGGGMLDGLGAGARFSQPVALAADPTAPAGAGGAVLVVDRGNSVIRRVTASGVTTTVAGRPMQPGYQDGLALMAQLDHPEAIAVAPDGVMVISDTGNHVIRRVDLFGNVQTLAGSAGQPGSADGAGGTARFDRPRGIAIAPEGVVFVADSGNHTIRQISPEGQVTTLAGASGIPGATDGPVSGARFFTPVGLARDAGGQLFVTEENHFGIRVISPLGMVTTRPGPGPTSAVAVDASGQVYLADCAGSAIWRAAAGAAPTVWAGGTAGYADGSGTKALFRCPSGIAFGAGGLMFVTDKGNDVIRQVDTMASVTTVAGAVSQWGAVDGKDARFSGAHGIVVDGAGVAYVADQDNAVIRRVTTDGNVTTLAGRFGATGLIDGVGPTARFSRPFALSRDASGNLYVLDRDAHSVRKITPAGEVSTYAGSSSEPGAIDGPGAMARFDYPSGIAANDEGLYIADCNNHAVRRVLAGGQVSTFVGALGVAGQADGPRLVARLSFPRLITARADGTMFLRDKYALRRVSTNGETVTLALDGIATALVAAPDALYGSSGRQLFRLGDDGTRTVIAGSPDTSAVSLGPIPGSTGELGGLSFTPEGDLFATPLVDQIIARIRIP